MPKLKFQDEKDRILAAERLLLSSSTATDKFNNLKTLIKGLNPDLDKKLDQIEKIINHIQKIQKADIIEFSLERIPENSEEEKKRKKLILRLLKNWKNLQSELKRVRRELESDDKTKQHHSNSYHAARIFSSLKGPFGLITLAAVIIIGGFLFFQKNKQLPQTPASVNLSPTPTTILVQGIIYNGKKVPLSELYVGHGSDCDSPHYHAKNEVSVTSLDGTVIPDPGGCGYGKVKDNPLINL